MMAIDWTQVTRRRPLRVILKMWHTDAPWAPSPDSRKPYILRCWLEMGSNGNMHVSRIEHEPFPFMSQKQITALIRPLRILLCEITGKRITYFTSGIFLDFGPVGEWPLHVPPLCEGPVLDYFKTPPKETRDGSQGSDTVCS